MLELLRREFTLWQWRRAFLRQRDPLAMPFESLVGERALVENDAEKVILAADLPRRLR